MTTNKGWEKVLPAAVLSRVDREVQSVRKDLSSGRFRVFGKFWYTGRNVNGRTTMGINTGASRAYVGGEWSKQCQGTAAPTRASIPQAKLMTAGTNRDFVSNKSAFLHCMHRHSFAVRSIIIFSSFSHPRRPWSLPPRTGVYVCTGETLFTSRSRQ